MPINNVGIITFHASHNFGSMLQAYALSKVVEQLGVNCEIINFQTDRQNDLYSIFTKRKGLKYKLKNLFSLVNYNSKVERYNKFSKFFRDNYKLGKFLYKNSDELKLNPPQYDAYICGSDQIWNYGILDSNLAYFLNFGNCIKISYAPSFGPMNKDLFEYKELLSNCISDINYISVREYEGQEIIKDISGRAAEALIDPTLLLPVKDWDNIIEQSNMTIKGDYILFYTLYADKNMVRLVKKVSKYYKLPIVVPNISNQYDAFAPFEKRINCGPADFIKLIKNAKLVLSSSFHGNVFSIIFNKPFYALCTKGDNRINTLLLKMNLQDRILNSDNINNLSFELNLNYDYLKNEQKRSLDFLKKALSIGD